MTDVLEQTYLSHASRPERHDSDDAPVMSCQSELWLVWQSYGARWRTREVNESSALQADRHRAGKRRPSHPQKRLRPVPPHTVAACMAQSGRARPQRRRKPALQAHSRCEPGFRAHAFHSKARQRGYSMAAAHITPIAAFPTRPAAEARVRAPLSYSSSFIDAW